MKRITLVLIFIPSIALSYCDENPGSVANLLGPTATQGQIDQGVADCAAIHAQQSTWLTELSTTSATLIGATTNYISATALGQSQINAKIVRINELKALLGIR